MVHQELEAKNILVERPGPRWVGRLEIGDYPFNLQLASFCFRAWCRSAHIGWRASTTAPGRGLSTHRCSAKQQLGFVITQRLTLRFGELLYSPRIDHLRVADNHVHIDDEVGCWSLPGEDHARAVFLGCPTLALNFEILSYLNAEEPFIPLHVGVTLQQCLTKPSLTLDQFLYQVIIHRLVEMS